MIQLGLNINNLAIQIEEVKEILQVVEEDAFKSIVLDESGELYPSFLTNTVKREKMRLKQAGVINSLFLIFYDQFWESNQEKLPENMYQFHVKWRKKLRGISSTFSSET